MLFRSLFDHFVDSIKAGFSGKALATGGLSAIPTQLGMLRGDLRGDNTGSATPAGDAYAALTRELWDTYVGDFMPYENKLISFATDRDAPAKAMARASELVGQSFDGQREATDRRLQGLGLTLDADEQQAADRSWGLSKSLADVTAQNNARDVTIQRQQSVLGNPVPTLPQI